MTTKKTETEMLKDRVEVLERQLQTMATLVSSLQSRQSQIIYYTYPNYYQPATYPYSGGGGTYTLTTTMNSPRAESDEDS